MLQASLTQQQQALEKKVKAPDYEKTPPRIQEENKEKASKLEQELQSILTALQKLGLWTYSGLMKILLHRRICVWTKIILNSSHRRSS